jgi:uncharacterized protein (TIGR03067 family)
MIRTRPVLVSSLFGLGVLASVLFARGPLAPPPPPESRQPVPIVGDPRPAPEQPLLGRWKLVRGRVAGKLLPADKDGDLALEFHSSWFYHVTRPGQKEQDFGLAYYTLDEKARPRHIDFTLHRRAGPGKWVAQECAGICEARGGRLRLAFAAGRANRPRDISSRAGVTVYELRREPPHPDEKRLPGSWRVTRTVRDGRAFPPGDDERHLIYTSRTLTRRFREEFSDPEFEEYLGPAGSNQITLLSLALDPTHPVAVLRGIYRVSGDRFTVCWNLADGGEPPMEFASRPGGSTILYECVRSDRDKLRGPWKLVSGETGGARMTDAEARAFAVRFEGSNSKLVERGQTSEFYWTVRQNVTPRRIELEIQRPRDGKRWHREKWAGVYELKGDELKLCVGPKDDAPRGFATRKGSSQRLLLLRREGPPR